MKSKFAAGRRWHCPNSGSRRPAFEFLIVGPATQGTDYAKKTYLLCKLVTPGTDQYYCDGETQPREFSKKHLQRYATLVESP